MALQGEDEYLPMNFYQEGEQLKLLEKGPSTIEIQCPVRMFHGMNDSVVPYSCSTKLLECLASDDVHVTLIKVGTASPVALLAINETAVGVEFTTMGGKTFSQSQHQVWLSRMVITGFLGHKICRQFMQRHRRWRTIEVDDALQQLKCRFKFLLKERQCSSTV